MGRSEGTGETGLKVRTAARAARIGGRLLFVPPRRRGRLPGAPLTSVWPPLISRANRKSSRLPQSLKPPEILRVGRESVASACKPATASTVRYSWKDQLWSDIGGLARKLLGSSNDRVVRRYEARVKAVAALEDDIAALTDEELRGETETFRSEIAAGKTVDDLLVPAFAVVREAAKRALGMRHFDVQMIGGMVLNSGAIAEMKTGEGKTLVATLAVYLNALEGKGVHVVTVNDYLASPRRRMDGPRLSLPRPDHRHHRPRPLRRAAPRRLCLRRHLRDEQRARLRLSARQHEVRARPDGPARPSLRHRRRGRTRS